MFKTQGLSKSAAVDYRYVTPGSDDSERSTTHAPTSLHETLTRASKSFNTALSNQRPLDVACTEPDMSQHVRSWVQRHLENNNLNYLYVHDQSSFDRLLSSALLTPTGNPFFQKGKLSVLFEKGGCLILNEAGFSAKELEALNEIKMERRFQDQTIANTLKVISLVDYSKMIRGERSSALVSRADYLSVPKDELPDPIIPLVVDAKEPTENEVVFDLSLFSEWEILFDAKVCLQPSGWIEKNPLLVSALEELKSVILRNPPLDDVTFQDKYLNIEKQFSQKNLSITLQNGYIESEISNDIKNKHVMSETELLACLDDKHHESRVWWVDASNADQFYGEDLYKIDGNTIVPIRPILATIEETELNNQPLLIVSHALSDHQWHGLMRSPYAFSIALMDEIDVPELFESIFTNRVDLPNKEVALSEIRDSAVSAIITKNPTMTFAKKSFAECERYKNSSHIYITPTMNFSHLVQKTTIQWNQSQCALVANVNDCHFLNEIQAGRDVYLYGLENNQTIARALQTLINPPHYLYVNTKRIDCTAEHCGRLTIVLPSDDAVDEFSGLMYWHDEFADVSTDAGLSELKNLLCSQFDRVLVNRLLDTLEALVSCRVNHDPIEKVFNYDRLVSLLHIASNLEKENTPGYYHLLKDRLIGSFRKDREQYALAKLQFKRYWDKPGENNPVEIDRPRLESMLATAPHAQWKKVIFQCANCLSPALIRSIFSNSTKKIELEDTFLKAIKELMFFSSVGDVIVEDRAPLKTPTQVSRRVDVFYQKVDHAFQNSRGIFLKSDPGFGKTHAIAHIQQRLYPDATEKPTHIDVSHVSEQSFFDRLQSWAQLTPEGAKQGKGLLVIDEANLSSQHNLDMLYELFKHGSLTVNGEKYLLSDDHRLIFTGNDDHFSGRVAHDIELDHFTTITLKSFSKEFIKQKILFPIIHHPYFENRLSPTRGEAIATCLADIHERLRIALPQTGFSVRHLEECLSHVLSRLIITEGIDEINEPNAKRPKTDSNAEQADSDSYFVDECGITYDWADLDNLLAMMADARNASTTYAAVLSKVSDNRDFYTLTNHDRLGLLEAFEDVYVQSLDKGVQSSAIQWLRSELQSDDSAASSTHVNHQLPLKNDDLIMTKSTIELSNRLDRWLHSQRVRVHFNPKTTQSLGQRGFLIEGPAGRGKDVLVANVLAKRGMSAEKGNVVFINAGGNLDAFANTVENAAKNGCVLVISEMNLLPTDFIESHVNGLLTGDAQGMHPDFLLIATVNPPSYAGREMLSPALLNRMVVNRIDHYSQEECVEIALGLAKKLYCHSMPANARDYAIKAFESPITDLAHQHFSLVTHAQEHGQAAPTIRELLRSVEAMVINPYLTVPKLVDQFYRYYLDQTGNISAITTDNASDHSVKNKVFSNRLDNSLLTALNFWYRAYMPNAVWVPTFEIKRDSSKPLIYNNARGCVYANPGHPWIVDRQHDHDAIHSYFRENLIELIPTLFSKEWDKEITQADLINAQFETSPGSDTARDALAFHANPVSGVGKTDHENLEPVLGTVEELDVEYVHRAIYTTQGERIKPQQMNHAPPSSSSKEGVITLLNRSEIVDDHLSSKPRRIALPVPLGKVPVRAFLGEHSVKVENHGGMYSVVVPPGIPVRYELITDQRGVAQTVADRGNRHPLRDPVDLSHHPALLRAIEPIKQDWHLNQLTTLEVANKVAQHMKNPQHFIYESDCAEDYATCTSITDRCNQFLKTRRGVCFEYAYTFANILEQNFDIECRIMSGYRVHDSEIDSEGHAWVLIQAQEDNTWHPIDPTGGSGRASRFSDRDSTMDSSYLLPPYCPTERGYYGDDKMYLPFGREEDFIFIFESRLKGLGVVREHFKSDIVYTANNQGTLDVSRLLKGDAKCFKQHVLRSSTEDKKKLFIYEPTGSLGLQHSDRSSKFPILASNAFDQLIRSGIKIYAVSNQKAYQMHTSYELYDFDFSAQPSVLNSNFLRSLEYEPSHYVHDIHLDTEKKSSLFITRLMTAYFDALSEFYINEVDGADPATWDDNGVREMIYDQLVHLVDDVEAVLPVKIPTLNGTIELNSTHFQEASERMPAHLIAVYDRWDIYELQQDLSYRPRLLMHCLEYAMRDPFGESSSDDSVSSQSDRSARNGSEFIKSVVAFLLVHQLSEEENMIPFIKSRHDQYLTHFDKAIAWLRNSDRVSQEDLQNLPNDITLLFDIDDSLDPVTPLARVIAVLRERGFAVPDGAV